jgi:uncharacterized protein (DUF58 family)
MSQQRSGRPPSLTARGTSWGWLGIILLSLGAFQGSAAVVSLGVAVLSALGVAYLRFYPTSVLVWRRHLEMSWALRRPEGDVAFIAGRPFLLIVTLRNRSPHFLGRARLRLFSSTVLDGPGPLSMALPPRSEAIASGELTARQIGTWHLHGAAVELRDPLGLCTVEAYFPNPLAIQVLPRPASRAGTVEPVAAGGAPHERLGLHALRRRGLGGDLRELREHAPGDPFKQIAWKATARTGRLMVRDLDRETLVTHHLLVDLASTMRRGKPGATKLDHAIDLATAYARSALEAGDRVGLLTFDGRVVAEVKPSDGPVHRLRLVEPLLDAMNAVDEDLTELTDGELVAAVARYLSYQEGLDARLRNTPAIDDPVWQYLATAPSGELYDLRLVFRAVQNALESQPVPRQSMPVASTLELARLRLYCRRRGIELPYRRALPLGGRAAGFAAALERAARNRGAQRIIVLSDLEELETGIDAIARSVRLARRRGHHLVCAAPSSWRFGGAEKDQDPVVGEIAAWDAQRRERAAFRRLGALGVRVVPVGPGDAAGALLQRIQGGRSAPRAA